MSDTPQCETCDQRESNIALVCLCGKCPPSVMLVCYTCLPVCALQLTKAYLEDQEQGKGETKH